MKMHRLWKKIAVLLAALLLLPCFSATAFAYEAVDIGREASLTVYFGEEGMDFPGVEFRLYRVADVAETGDLALTGDFAEYPVSLKDLDSSGWRALAQTLDAYAARDGLTPLKVIATDQSGQAVFEQLSVGLYLITADCYDVMDIYIRRSRFSSVFRMRKTGSGSMMWLLPASLTANISRRIIIR